MLTKIGNKCPNCGKDIFDMELLEDEYTLPDDPREYQLYQCSCGVKVLHFYDADKDEDINYQLKE